jgi:hypothetical protein
VSRLLKFVAAALVVLVLGGLTGLVWLDFRSRRSPSQVLFRQGTVPQPPPDGDYKGSVNAYHGGWVGKTFDAKQSAGRNLFSTPSGVERRYPFRTLVGPGLADPIPVFKIDYAIAGNPAWLRSILDEIVQVGPNHYLGRIHLRMGPMHFSVGYFELRK